MRIEIDVPATTSNLGPGFDAVGMALQLSSTFVCETQDSETAPLPGGDRTLQIDVEGYGADELPRDSSHLVVATIAASLATHGRALPNLRLLQTNQIPLGSGLGSSSTAIVGGLAIAQALLGMPLDRELLLKDACRLERHPDNAAPCVLGGLVTATYDGEAVHAVPLPIAPGLGCVVCTPDLQLSTVAMRAALPAEVPFADAVFNGTHACLLIAALATGRLELLAEATQDRLHQRFRAAHVPGFEAVVAGGQAAGALTTLLSGAGPTVIALIDTTRCDAAAIARAMEAGFASVGLASTSRIVQPRPTGVVVQITP